MKNLTVKYKVDALTNEYGLTKRYLLFCNANDSFPEYIDHLFDHTMVCYIKDYILEVEFDDDNHKIIYHQIVERDTLNAVKDDEITYKKVYTAINDEAYDYVYKLIAGLI